MADDPGGKGGDLTPNLSPNQTSDTRLIEKAIRQRWDIPPDIREAMPKELSDIIKTGKSHRNKIAASRALLAADSLNLQQEQFDRGAGPGQDRPSITIVEVVMQQPKTVESVSAIEVTNGRHGGS
jgi:hypothetical protein